MQTDNNYVFHYNDCPNDIISLRDILLLATNTKI